MLIQIPQDKLPKVAYHKSNPMFREAIAKEGLLPQPPSDFWIEMNNRVILRHYEKALFATLTENKAEIFCHEYDDDIYEIDLSQLTNTWFKDPYIEQDRPADNFENCRAFTPTGIPLSAIKLIYAGTGEPL